MCDDDKKIYGDNSESGFDKKGGYSPLDEGYTPNGSEQDSLPTAPDGGSGETKSDTQQ